jgi:DNA repair exonuclease SbcCD ATPase subunit
MRIERIELENYGPFLGSHTFGVSGRGLVLVLGENLDEPRMNSNGSGKSSLFDALDWTLFGVIPKGDHVDSVINDEAKAVKGRVALWDEDRNLGVMVERLKERGKATQLQFWVGDQAQAALDLTETQRLLENELGLDREVFHATVFYGQADTFHFAEATEARRMELLSRILPELAVIDGWSERAKAAAKTVTEEMGALESSIGQLTARIMEHQASAADAVARHAQWEQAREAKLLAKQQRGEELNAQRGHNLTLLAGEEAARNALAQAEAAVVRPVADVSGLDAQIQNEQRGLQGWIAQEGIIQGQAKAIQAALTKMQVQKAGTCSQCGQPVTAEHLAREVSRFQQELTNLGFPLGDMQAKVKAAHATIATLQTQRRQEVERADALHREQQTQLANLRRQVESFAQIRAMVTAQDRELATLRQDWLSIKGEQNPWAVAAGDTQQKIAALDAQRDGAKLALNGKALQQRYVDFWVDAFANKGLKNYILDHRLGEMTDAANHWVKLLTGGTIWVRFETQKMGRSTKRLSNDINIRVFRYNTNGTITERNYKSWSGGEKRRVSWAIDFGLSRLVAARARKRWDALVLDEVFKHVDAKGGEAVVEMLGYLKRERSSIFVVEHDSDFQAHFEQRVTIRKQNGRAAIMESVNEQRQQQGLPGDGQAILSEPEPPKKKKQGRKVQRRGVSAGVRSGASDGGGDGERGGGAG